MVLRVVRDRTQPTVRAFEIIQARAIVLFVTVHSSTRPDSPGLLWQATITAPNRRPIRAQRTTGHGANPEEAYLEAAFQIAKVSPKGGLPHFTVAEWETVTDQLRAQGAFDHA